MTNGDRGGQLISEILRSFSAAYNWDNYKPELKTIVSLGDEEINKLAGQYQWTYQGRDYILEITVLENHLKGIQAWDDFSFEIYPETATKFFNKEDGKEFEISMDEEGAVNGMTIYEGSREYFFVFPSSPYHLINDSLVEVPGLKVRRLARYSSLPASSSGI